MLVFEKTRRRRRRALTGRRTSGAHCFSKKREKGNDAVGWLVRIQSHDSLSKILGFQFIDEWPWVPR